MESIILTTRFGARRTVVRVDASSLTSLEEFKEALCGPHSISEAVEAFILVQSQPGSATSTLIEVQLADVSDLGALR